MKSNINSNKLMVCKIGDIRFFLVVMGEYENNLLDLVWWDSFLCLENVNGYWMFVWGLGLV